MLYEEGRRALAARVSETDFEGELRSSFAPHARVKEAFIAEMVLGAEEGAVAMGEHIDAVEEAAVKYHMSTLHSANPPWDKIVVIHSCNLRDQLYPVLNEMLNTMRQSGALIQLNAILVEILCDSCSGTR